MGSDSDLKVMSKAAVMLEELGIEYEMTIISAHREPDVFFEYAKSAESKGFKVIIAGAGMASHLPGMCAALFPLPVIGIPMKTSDLGGVDSLYSIVQMPSGIPVATVAINGGATFTDVPAGTYTDIVTGQTYSGSSITVDAPSTKGQVRVLVKDW